MKNKKEIKKEIQENKKQWNKGFADGLWYAIQQIAIYCNESDAEFLVKESGIPEREFKQSQKETGFENRRMNKLLKNVFKKIRLNKI